MKKTACILGIILSIALVVLGISILTGGVPNPAGGMLTFDGVSGSYASTADYSGSTVSYSSFGADFYTYIYRATRVAVENIDLLGEYLDDVLKTISRGVNAVNDNVDRIGSYMEGLSESVVGGGLIIVGLFGALLSLYGLGAAIDSARQIELLSEIARRHEASAPAASPLAASAYRAPVSRHSEGGERWVCPGCKHQNPSRLTSCDICGEPRPSSDA